MSLLLVDAGNTRIKWALVEPADVLGKWTASGAVAREALARLAEDWQGMQASRILVSNVAGTAAMQALSLAVQQSMGAAAPVLEAFHSSAERAGLRNAYRDPRQLGSDRFAAAIGARALYPGEDLVVATCGTATTIDSIAADGVFMGGMILPGLRLMAAALAMHTAQLPEVSGRVSSAMQFADNTDDAIALGCLNAQAGAIDRARAQRPGARCIISGGAGRILAPFLEGTPTWIDNLVLVGLHAAAMEKGN